MPTKRSSGILITFSGVDGSGKTTYTKHLVNSLREKGIDCSYVYGRLEPIILRPFIIIGRRLFLRKKDIFTDYRDYSNTKKKKISKHKYLFKIYYLIMLFDYIMQLLWKVKIPLLFGRNVLCDRYIFDTIVTDLAVDMDYSYNDLKDKIDMFLRFLSVPDLCFYVEVSANVAFKRKDDTPSLEYLQERIGLYDFVADQYKMIRVDGNDKLERNKLFIEDIVFKDVLG
ncbi:hypothetical protein [Methanothermobacter sp. K4]|uniref:hypothetical protein n=1 Tax=Methanothermobacter sp. K4 TaxID=2913262 RepID=UPI001EDAFCF7|nr:hypothetical protein [Methanothermobacter sp. K4]MCG2829231.1 hypothetical protein [Methanothermobacter sp. K4]